MSESPEITITVHGQVGVGKSAVSLAILDALRAAGLQCAWDEEQSERNLGTGAADIAALEQRPTIRLQETNPSMASHSPIGRLELRQGQIQALADFAGEPIRGTPPEDQDVLVLTLAHGGHSGPGLYAHFEDVPEGGALFLGIPEGDPQLLFADDVPHPRNGDERRWFMAGASAVATGRAFVNAGDSEQQFIADGAAELPEWMLTGQAKVDGHAVDWVGTDPQPNFRGMALIDTAQGYLSTALDDLDSSPDPRPAGLVKEAMACIKQAMLGGQHGFHMARIPTTEVYAPEYFTRAADGTVSFCREGAKDWPEWAVEADHAMHLGLSSKPSPGGQGDAPPCWWIDHGTHGQITQRQDEADAAVNAGKRVVSYAARQPVAGLSWADYWMERGQPDVAHDFDAFSRAEAWALQRFPAARQPVGEPVAVRVTPEMRAAFRRAFREGGFWNDRLDTALDAMMRAAPPAQAVDLGAVREAVRKAWQKCAAGESVDLQFGTLLALIDSKTVGHV